MSNIEPKENPGTDTSPRDASECCKMMSTVVDSTLAPPKAFIRRNPIATVLGALSFGVFLGYMIAVARRDEPTLCERIVDEPLQKARDAIQVALAPIVHRLHDGYDAAREGIGRTRANLTRFRPSHSAEAWLGQLGQNLKLWKP